MPVITASSSLSPTTGTPTSDLDALLTTSKEWLDKIEQREDERVAEIKRILTGRGVSANSDALVSNAVSSAKEDLAEILGG